MEAVGVCLGRRDLDWKASVLWFSLMCLIVSAWRMFSPQYPHLLPGPRSDLERRLLLWFLLMCCCHSSLPT